MSQKIEYIAVKDLVLWTENPRDPIDELATDQDVVDRALADPSNKWQLSTLAKQMGDYYDYSELPIVVYKKKRPIVYDGNRRIVLAKVKLGCCKVEGLAIPLPKVDAEIPCNVCSEDIALQSVHRKHFLVGNSWGQLERDIFAHKYMNEPKSRFLIFDECTGGFVSKNPIINRRFVKEEILSVSNLSRLGFSFENDRLLTVHSDDEVEVLLSDILGKIESKEVSTRTNRHNIFLALDQRCKDIISDNKDKEARPYIVKSEDSKVGKILEESNKSFVRKTPVTRKPKIQLFGKKLVLNSGPVNNLYRDLSALYDIVEGNNSFSNDIYAIFRMGLRLLCETASKEDGFRDINDYIKKHYSVAKKNLSQDTKTLLSVNNVNEDTMPQLLHIGAHNYMASTSKDQTIAVSIMLGAILEQTHGK